MSKKYCFRIINPGKKTINMDELEIFVRELYNKNSEDPSKLTFVPFYSQATDSICIQIKGRGKTVIENIEKINSILKDEDLKWKDGISLSKPYVPDDRQVLSFEVTPGRKWDSIKQRGPYFKEIMEPYEPLGASLGLRTNSKIKYKLKPEEEKIARFYVNRMLSEAGKKITVRYTTTKESDTEEQKNGYKIFNINFWEDFKTYLSPEAKKFLITKPESKDAVSENFLNIDWSDLIKLHLLEIEKNKENAKDRKDRKTKKDAEKMAEYGYATINGIPLQKVGNFSVEESGIFLGRGVNPLLGKIKKQILPEDVTLNMGKDDPIPEPPPGHNWGKDNIVHDYNKEWLASWKDNVTGRTKYIWFSQEGAFKAQSDIKKYEKARKLHIKIEEIRNGYMLYANSTNAANLQLGTVLYLIDHFGIRVGNEKDEDEAETVGATTLLVSNVNLDTQNHVIFDFRGKDSVPFYKDLEVDPVIFNNFKKLTKDKDPKQQIFTINSDSINKYLKKFDKDFSAKVFRTRLASDIMYHALQTVKIPDKSVDRDIKLFFTIENAKVAEVLNHVRTQSIRATETLDNLKSQLNEAISKKDTKKIETLTRNIASKETVLTVAINTSLANYIDPRLVISWAKREKVKPSSIYTPILLNKFKWAVESTEDGWDWEQTPLENEDESPTKPSASKTPPRQSSTAKTPPSQPSADRRPPRQPSADRRPPSQPSAAKTPPQSSAARRPPSQPSAAKTPPQSSAAKKPPSQPSADRRSPPPPQSSSNVTFKIPPPRQKQDPFSGKLGPGTIKDYKLLLQLCEDLKNYSGNISKVETIVLDWIYPFCKEAIDRGVNIDATKFIVNYYETRLKRPEDDTPVMENVRTPPSKKVPT